MTDPVRIEELAEWHDREADDNEHEPDLSQCHRDTAASLRAYAVLLGKLLVTEDGAVVVPGETYYCLARTEPDEPFDWVGECHYVGHAEPHVDYKWEVHGGGSDWYCDVRVFSTRAAAESAKGDSRE